MKRKRYTFIVVEIIVFIALCLSSFIDFSAKEAQGNDLLVTVVSDIHNWKGFTQTVDEEKVFIKPCRGPISSKYGYRIHPVYRRWHFHTGIDIKAPLSTKVFASAPGEVVFSGWKPGYGKLVVIRHPNGYETYYGHNSVNLVRVGQSVERYQEIARVGETGTTTGPHLHFEIRKNGRPQHPLLYLR